MVALAKEAGALSREWSQAVAQEVAAELGGCDLADAGVLSASSFLLT
jgi:hypothetical protein